MGKKPRSIQSKEYVRVKRKRTRREEPELNLEEADALGELMAMQSRNLSDAEEVVMKKAFLNGGISDDDPDLLALNELTESSEPFFCGPGQEGLGTINDPRFRYYGMLTYVMFNKDINEFSQCLTSEDENDVEDCITELNPNPDLLEAIDDINWDLLNVEDDRRSRARKAQRQIAKNYILHSLEHLSQLEEGSNEYNDVLSRLQGVANASQSPIDARGIGDLTFGSRRGRGGSGGGNPTVYSLTDEYPHNAYLEYLRVMGTPSRLFAITEQSKNNVCVVPPLSANEIDRENLIEYARNMIGVNGLEISEALEEIGSSLEYQGNPSDRIIFLGRSKYISRNDNPRQYDSEVGSLEALRSFDPYLDEDDYDAQEDIRAQLVDLHNYFIEQRNYSMIPALPTEEQLEEEEGEEYE